MMPMSLKDSSTLSPALLKIPSTMVLKICASPVVTIAPGRSGRKPGKKPARYSLASYQKHFIFKLRGFGQHQTILSLRGAFVLSLHPQKNLLNPFRMALQAGIVGLPNVGKSTLFNALSNAKAQAANFPFCTIEPNVGVITVPDERLIELEGW